MDDFAKALEHVSDCIKEYRQMKEQDGMRLNYLLQQITGTLFYLEKHRGDIHASYQSEVQRLVLSGSSVARADNEAHVKFPEMYMLRRVMDAGYTVVDAIRSNISSLNRQRIE